jgi:glycosyltransferase involved in cell wall biosynthesis
MKKKILLYSEYWSSFGGGEKYLACCAEALLRTARYDVTIIAQTTSFDKDAVARYFNVDLSGITVRTVDGELEAMRAEAERLSAEFDIFIYMTNYRFIPSRARQTFVILQVPYGSITPFSLLKTSIKQNLKEAGKDVVRRKMFKRLHDTQAVIVYSRFVQLSLDVIHDIPSTVIEPPIDDFLVEGATKERVILSVGRFFNGLYNNKRYDVLIDAFKKLCDRLPNTTWHYRLVGSCGADEDSQAYLEQLQNAARGFPIYFHVNAPYDDLQRHYNEATIFWHAAGFDGDEDAHPERAEHFGMSTLEAMSARCAPVVINAGGQKEIVSHGESGYLWSSVDELVEHSIKLISTDELLAVMQTKARERFGEFDREHFSKKLLSTLEL